MSSAQLNHKQPILAPSLICLDLCNLEDEVKRLSSVGIHTLHIDILDGVFSPSLPIGIDMIQQLRAKTDLNFDVHLMTCNNEFFIDALLDIGVQSLCFHSEVVSHVDFCLDKIKRRGVKAGIALKPSTPIYDLQFILEMCDFVLLMLINPGYAGNNDVMQVPYAEKKIKALKYAIDKSGLDTRICIDGRISWKDVFKYAHGDVDQFVIGSTCMNDDFEYNFRRFLQEFEDV